MRRCLAVEMREFKFLKHAGLSFKLRLHVQKHRIANGTEQMWRVHSQNTSLATEGALS